MEYISRPGLMEKLTSSEMQQKIKAMSGTDAYNEFLTLVNSEEKADVAPVRHGHWIEDGSYQICSECGEEHSWNEYRASYCEDCGARMDGGADNE